jgi:glycosyltransferase involved in cell wall biosynthesis
MTRPRVTLLRGHHANPWDLRPWQLLGDRYDVRCLVTGRNIFETSNLGVSKVPARALGDFFPHNRAGNIAAYAIGGERYLSPRRHLAGSQIVHSAEIRSWFSLQAARLKHELDFKLVVTVWETIPFRRTYGLFRERRWRDEILPAVDLFLPTTERARDGLLLEGAPAEAIEVCPPGIDQEHFGRAREQGPQPQHLILSPGRLVWQKGHQDVLRAAAALVDGVVAAPTADFRVLIVGSGPEEKRLRKYARDLGIDDRVDFRRSVAYDDMPGVYASASCMVLASLPKPQWEEQFGMVLAEAMAAGVPVVASASGAIPEVVGDAGVLFSPGDWVELARALARGPLSGPPSARGPIDPARVERFSTRAAADRLAAAYERLLAD